jgi:hypothetical protein
MLSLYIVHRIRLLMLPLAEYGSIVSLADALAEEHAC